MSSSDAGAPGAATDPPKGPDRDDADKPRTVPPDHAESGLATAEYAIVMLAAVGFAALLVAVLSSGEVRDLLMSLITSALNFG